MYNSGKPHLRIRRGVTRTIRLTLLDGSGRPVNLSDVPDITVRWSLDGSGIAYTIGTDSDYSIKPIISGDDGNILQFVWYADQQPRRGCWTFLVILDYGDRNIDRFDWHGITGIELVDHAIEERIGVGEGIDAAAYIDLTGQMTMNGVGQSAYESWIAQGHTGSEADFIAWLRQPAEDAADDAADTVVQLQAETRRAVTELEAEVDDKMAAVQQQAYADHSRAEVDHTLADEDHQQAGQDHGRAETDHTTATQDHEQAGGDHTRAEADNLQAVSDHNVATSDHTRAEADHSTAGTDHQQAGADHQQAVSDHARAEADHSTVLADHQQAGQDHGRAETDHTTATQDHEQAGGDHTRAEGDHTVAERDHTASAAATEAANDAAETANTAAENAEAARESIEGELARKADVDGSYDTMAVGIAKNLEGRTNVTGSFLERTTGGDADVANGLAQLNEVRGRSVKWNQIMRPLTANGPWTDADVTITNNKDGSYTFNGTASANGSLNAQNRIVVNVLKTHKYYAFISQPDGVITLSNTAFAMEVLSGNARTSEILVPQKNGNQYFRLSVIKGVTYNNTTVSPFLIDLTALFGSGNEPATVEEFESWLESNVGLREYYPYDAGSIVNNAMEAVETIGRNLLDPATGKARIVGAYSDVFGNYYGITGTHGALTFASDFGETSTITPDSDGKFLLETSGWLTVADAGADCAVFLWWDGTQTDYVEYERNEAPLDVTHIYGKLNGEGELVQVWPMGMPGIGDLKDALKIVDGAVVAEVKIAEVDLGTRTYTKTTANYFWAAIPNMKTASANRVANLMAIPYQAVSNNALTSADKVMAGFTTNASNRLYINDSSHAESDAAAFKAAMNGVKLLYERATPILYTDLVYQGSEYFADGTPVALPLNFPVDNWGLERILPQNTSEAVVTCAPELVCRYSVDAVEELDTIRSSAIFVEDLKANIQALLAIVNDKLGETMGGTIAIVSTPTDKVYPFTFVPTPEPTPDTIE